MLLCWKRIYLNSHIGINYNLFLSGLFFSYPSQFSKSCKNTPTSAFINIKPLRDLFKYEFIYISYYTSFNNYFFKINYSKIYLLISLGMLLYFFLFYWLLSINFEQSVHIYKNTKKNIIIIKIFWKVIRFEIIY